MIILLLDGITTEKPLEETQFTTLVADKTSTDSTGIYVY